MSDKLEMVIQKVDAETFRADYATKYVWGRATRADTRARKIVAKMLMEV